MDSLRLVQMQMQAGDGPSNNKKQQDDGILCGGLYIVWRRSAGITFRAKTHTDSSR
jgi:hypothetical protein